MLVISWLQYVAQKKIGNKPWVWENYMHIAKSDFKAYPKASSFLQRLFPPPWKVTERHRMKVGKSNATKQVRCFKFPSHEQAISATAAHFAISRDEVYSPDMAAARQVRLTSEVRLEDIYIILLIAMCFELYVSFE